MSHPKARGIPLRQIEAALDQLPDGRGTCDPCPTPGAWTGRACPAKWGRWELSTSLLFTRKSNPGKSVGRPGSAERRGAWLARAAYSPDWISA